MALALEEFAKKHGLKLRSMTIDEAVSPYPRTILLPECPKCKNNLFLSHPVHRPDPFIEMKRDSGIFPAKYPGLSKWLVSCWTEGCDFYLALRATDLARCPVCKRRFMDLYSLYDHMKYQCTKAARTNEMLKKAGVDKYQAGLMLID